MSLQNIVEAVAKWHLVRPGRFDWVRRRGWQLTLSAMRTPDDAVEIRAVLKKDDRTAVGVSVIDWTGTRNVTAEALASVISSRILEAVQFAYASAEPHARPVGWRLFAASRRGTT